MRIPDTTPATKDIAEALTRAYFTGRDAGVIEARLGHGRARKFDLDGITGELLANLDHAGFEIVRKTPRLGTVATLTPEGERIVQAIAAGDFTGISDRDYRSFTVLVDRVLEGDRTSARLRDLDAAIHRAERSLSPGEERPLPAGEAVRYDYVRDPHLETPLRAGEERPLPRGEVVTSDETDADADEIDRLAREAAPDADGPADIEEQEDGTIRVTSCGLAEIAGMNYGTAGWWFRMNGLKGHVDLDMIEQVLAGQEEGWQLHAGTESTELSLALKGVRHYRAEHAGKRAAAADEVRAAAARLALLKALAAARLVIPHRELVEIVSQLDTGRAA